MIKASFEEIRVLVSICYEGIEEDETLLDEVQNVDDFEAVQQQQYGCCFLAYGFIIFQGITSPTELQKKKMEREVKRAVTKIKRALRYRSIKKTMIIK